MQKEMGKKCGGDRLLLTSLFVLLLTALGEGGTSLNRTAESVLIASTTVAAAAAARDENVNNSSLPVAAATAAGPRTPGNVGCRGLRSKRYISDGFCRTIKPISEVLCTGYCVPERHQQWYPEFMQVWGKAKVMEYRCVDGVVRNKKIKLLCDNGKIRVYSIKVVKSCACRKQVRTPFNQSQSSQGSSDRDPTAPTTTRHERKRHGKKRQPPSNA